MSRQIKVFQAGRMDYQSALQLQKILSFRHHDKTLPPACHDTLVLVEHDPVYTTGIRSKSYTEQDGEKLRNLGAEFHRSNRGGLITFHGPGQLVAYPVLNLKHFTPSVRWYVDRIEKTIVRLCGELCIAAETSPHTGVWVRDKKICAIGIHASRFVTTHGLALNCDTDLRWFRHIVPCGIEGKGVTSVSRELGQGKTIEDILPLFLESFSELFDCTFTSFPQRDREYIMKLLQSEASSRPTAKEQ